MNHRSVEKLIPTYLKNSTIYSLIVTDLEGKYSFVNHTFKQRFSFLETDFIGQPFTNSVHPDDIDKGNQVAMECIMNPDRVIEVKLRKPLDKDGTYYETQWEFSLLKDENENPIGILCLGYDYTPTRLANVRNEALDLQLRALVDSSLEGIVLISLDYKVIMANKQANINSTAIFGKIFEPFSDIYDYVLPGDLEDFEEHTKKSMTGEKVLTERKIGGHWFSFKYSPVYDNEANLVCISLSTKSITEQKALEEYKSTLLNNIPDLLLVIDKNGLLKDVKSKDNNFDYDAMIDKPLSEYFDEESLNTLLPIIENDFGMEEVKEFDYFKDINNEKRVFEARVSKLNQQEFIILARDITDFNNRQIIILNQNKILKEIAWQQSHEIRRPVANILGIGILLKKHENSNSKELNQLISLLIQSTEVLDQVIHKIVNSTAEIIKD